MSSRNDTPLSPSQVHPKLKKVHDLLTTWMKRSAETRTLIVIPRMFEYTAPNLEAFLSAIKGVKVNKYPDNTVTEDVFMKVLANVLFITQWFP